MKSFVEFNEEKKELYESSEKIINDFMDAIMKKPQGKKMIKHYAGDKTSEDIKKALESKLVIKRVTNNDKSSKIQKLSIDYSDKDSRARIKHTENY